VIFISKISRCSSGEEGVWFGNLMITSLHCNLRAAESVDVFKNRLKTHVSNLAFN